MLRILLAAAFLLLAFCRMDWRVNINGQFIF